MKSCPYCAEEIQDAAIVCKHCGRDLAPLAAPAPAPPPPAKGTSLIVKAGLWFTVLFVGAGVTRSCLAAPDPTETMRQTIGDGPGAAAVCREFVKDRLKSPTSATFQPTKDAEVERVQDSWLVRSHVDSQNGFGAMLRTGYVCAVTYDKTSRKWHLDNLTIEKR